MLSHGYTTSCITLLRNICMSQRVKLWQSQGFHPESLGEIKQRKISRVVVLDSDRSSQPRMIISYIQCISQEYKKIMVIMRFAFPNAAWGDNQGS